MKTFLHHWAQVILLLALLKYQLIYYQVLDDFLKDKEIFFNEIKGLLFFILVILNFLTTDIYLFKFAYRLYFILFIFHKNFYIL